MTYGLYATSGSWRRPRNAFTLMELLLVVAVIAILAALLLAALRSVRLRARSTQCASNMRQIGVAIAGYAQDNKGRFPETTHTTGATRLQSAWIFALKPYLGNTDEVRVCPADPRAEQIVAAQSTSYILNEYISVPGIGAALRIDDVPIPSKTHTVFIGSDTRSLSSFSDHTHSRNWFKNPISGNWTRINRDIKPDRHGVTSSPRNSAGIVGWANYLFADAHVEEIDAASLKTLADNNENFAIPPAVIPAGAWMGASLPVPPSDPPRLQDGQVVRLPAFMDE